MDWIWARQSFGSAAADRHAVDDQGNIYLAAYYSSQAIFGCDTLNSNEATDIA